MLSRRQRPGICRRSPPAPAGTGGDSLQLERLRLADRGPARCGSPSATAGVRSRDLHIVKAGGRGGTRRSSAARAPASAVGDRFPRRVGWRVPATTLGCCHGRPTAASASVPPRPLRAVSWRAGRTTSGDGGGGGAATRRSTPWAARHVRRASMVRPGPPCPAVEEPPCRCRSSAVMTGVGAVSDTAAVEPGATVLSACSAASACLSAILGAVLIGRGPARSVRRRRRRREAQLGPANSGRHAAPFARVKPAASPRSPQADRRPRVRYAFEAMSQAAIEAAYESLRTRGANRPIVGQVPDGVVRVDP